jgi:hypothetical protein
MAGPAIDTGFVVPVTAEAPSHLQIDATLDAIHGGHIVVTLQAVDSCLNMCPMGKIDMLRKLIDPDPFYRSLAFHVFKQFDDFRAVFGDMKMTGLTGLQRWNAGNRRDLDTPVAVSTVDAVLPGMQTMAECDRLLR